MTSGSRLRIAIRNRLDLASRHGASFGEAMDRLLLVQLQELCGGRARIQRTGNGNFLVSWEGLEPFEADLESRNRYAESLLSTVGERAQGIDGVRFAILDAAWDEKDRASKAHAAPIAAPTDVESQDMEVAQLVYDALLEGRFVLQAQPVCSVDNQDVVLYLECLMRLRSNDGSLMFPASFIPNLERTGLVRWFDRFVVRHVIRLLRADPDLSLGVNISARSAVDDVLWASIFIDLADAPEVACRLVFEITETAPLEEGRGRLFAQRLKQLGCRVAIDDFGASYGVETSIEVRSPDIIKLDASLLSGANLTGRGERRLAGMASLAADISRCVVVEGITSEEDVEKARRAGVPWGQGYYFERHGRVFD